MGVTYTTNYNLIRPNPFEEEDAWASLLNINLTNIDTILFSKLTSTAAVSSVAGLTPVADRLAYYTGASTAALTTLTAFARSLMAGVDAAAMRATLGLGGLATLSAVGAAEITDGSVGTAELANLSVTTAKLADGAVTAAKIASGVIPAAFPSGTRMLFQQTAAPTGWTKDTTQNDKALRVVSGAVGSGGSLAFSSAFVNRGFSGSTSTDAVSGTVGDTALTIAQIPAHTHTYDKASATTTNTRTPAFTAITSISQTSTDTGSAGSGATHTHTFTGGSHAHSFSGSIDMAVQYIDLIIASKD